MNLSISVIYTELILTYPLIYQIQLILNGIVTQRIKTELNCKVPAL